MFATATACPASRTVRSRRGCCVTKRDTGCHLAGHARHSCRGCYVLRRSVYNGWPWRLQYDARTLDATALFECHFKYCSSDWNSVRHTQPLFERLLNVFIAGAIDRVLVMNHLHTLRCVARIGENYSLSCQIPGHVAESSGSPANISEDTSGVVTSAQRWASSLPTTRLWSAVYYE